MPTQIVFLVLPKVHLLDLAGADQVFFEARDYGADITIKYCSLEKDLSASNGLPFGTLPHFESINFCPGDYLVIPGAEIGYLTSKTFSSEKQLFEWVLQAHTMGINICSVCTGAFVLGYVGLLDGRKCTTHWKRTVQLQKHFPAAKVMEDTLFTEDNRIYTSAGVASGIDLALFILSKITNEQMSYKVARELVVYLRRRDSDTQQSVFMKYRNHIHSGVHHVQDYLHQNIQQKITIEDLADTACMSVRTLTRTFKKEVGITINAYAMLIREERVRQLSKNPDMSRKQLAKACGLKSERQIIRILNTINAPSFLKSN